MALSVGVVGFLVAAQLGTTQRGAENLAAESESDLTRIFSSLNEESAALRDEISQLRLELASLQSSAERDQLARDASQRQLTDLQILAGVVPARGPGVAVRIDDPNGVLRVPAPPRPRPGAARRRRRSHRRQRPPGRRQPRRSPPGARP